MVRFRDKLDVKSQAKYLLWRTSRFVRSNRDVVVRIKGGPRLLVRARPARDLETAYDPSAAFTKRSALKLSNEESESTLQPRPGVSTIDVRANICSSAFPAQTSTS
jgi:hypothetical protein